MTALYRTFDADGRLLYVGVSGNVQKRLGQHKNKSAGFAQMARHTVVEYPTREDALAAETEAIGAEHPAFNVTGRVPTAEESAASKARFEAHIAGVLAEAPLMTAQQLAPVVRMLAQYVSPA